MPNSLNGRLAAQARKRQQSDVLPDGSVRGRIPTTQRTVTDVHNTVNFVSDPRMLEDGDPQYVRRTAAQPTVGQ